MESKPIIYKTKSGIVIMPKAVQQLHSYTQYYVRELQRYLDEYHVANSYLQHTSETMPCENVHAHERAQQELMAAQQTKEDLKALQDELQRIYTWNFERLAEVFRQARIFFEQRNILDVFTIKVVLDYLMYMLQKENPKFDREMFITAINRNPEEQPITNRAVRRLSTAQQ